MGDSNSPPSPAVPGFHAVGKIHALGDKLDSAVFQIDHRVAVLLPEGGGNAKYVSVPKERVIKLPEDAEHEDIICLLASYMTAYQCLKIAKKDGAPLTLANVLVLGGGSPAGQALLELAHREGAKVYATADPMHRSHLEGLGARWFPAAPETWLPALVGKMDVVVVDGPPRPDGGARAEAAYAALAPDGALIRDASDSGSHLQTAASRPWFFDTKARAAWDRTLFYNLHDAYADDPRMFGHELRYLICLLQRGEIAPKVAGRVRLNQVPRSQKLIEKVRWSLPWTWALFLADLCK